jgi:GNAT superfamily N-acetyltransferase
MEVSMELDIRRAFESDKEAFINLSIGLTEYNYKNRPSKTTLADRIERRRSGVSQLFDEHFNREDMLILMAFSKERPIGYATLYIYNGLDGDYGYLDEIYVEESIRGYGVGNKLLTHAIDWVKSKKGIRMALNVYVWNKSSISFYEKSGFIQNYIQYDKKLL